MSPSGLSRQNIAMTFGKEKLEWFDYRRLKNFEDMFIRFDRIHERDRQTDRHTDTVWRKSIARFNKLENLIGVCEWCLLQIYVRPPVTLRFDPKSTVSCT